MSARRVLLVDDDPGVADSVAHAFRLHGFDVDVAASVTAAEIDYQDRGVDWYDVMIVDWQLGDGTGIDFLAGISSSDKARTVLWSGLDRSAEVAASGMHVDLVTVKDASLEMLDVVLGWFGGEPCAS